MIIKNLGTRRKERIVKLIKADLRKNKNLVYNYQDALEEISSLKRRGFRTAVIYILTSLVDQPATEIEALYLKRWGVEVDIRNFKVSLEKQMLRSKSPSMARKELWVSLIAYNLVRSFTVALSNIYTEVGPRKRSFKTTLSVYLSLMTSYMKVNLDLILHLLGSEILNSKYRREARAIKKRNNRYPLLTTSRGEANKQSWGYSRRQQKQTAPSVEAA